MEKLYIHPHSIRNFSFLKASSSLRECTCWGPHVEVRRQRPSRFSPSAMPIPGSNSGHQAWQQAPLPAESSWESFWVTFDRWGLGHSADNSGSCTARCWGWWPAFFAGEAMSSLQIDPKPVKFNWSSLVSEQLLCLQFCTWWHWTPKEFIKLLSTGFCF